MPWFVHQILLLIGGMALVSSAFGDGDIPLAVVGVAVTAFATMVPGPIRAFKSPPRNVIKKIELVVGPLIVIGGIIIGRGFGSKAAAVVTGLLVLVAGLRADTRDPALKKNRTGSQRADNLGRTGGRLAANAIKAAKNRTPKS
jgi:hypothetical protein